MVGQTISHYNVLAKLGEGGMGVVYKAEDTKLERTVALKFLAAHLLHDNEAKQRFLREAKAAAALHHPNICTVHEIDEVEGKTFLAMAFLEGEALDERIANGPLPLKDVLEIGRQVAAGLAAAHAKGIVHRDIKPANILVSPEGRATIMDFGLARLTEASKLTRADQTVGTTAYMSPEQIQGGEVDHRSDIWALGCVLYEMVAGVRPFKGQYDQALLYEIVNQEPEPLTGLRTGVPIEVDYIAGKCLAKDREDRPASAQEVSRELRTLGEKLKSGSSTILRSTSLAATALPSAGEPGSPVVAPRSSSLRIWQALFAFVTLALLGLTAVHFNQAPPERPVTRFSFTPEGITSGGLPRTAPISPNGRYILYVAQTDGESSLWLRSLNDESARQIPGTEGAIDCFWSPDNSEVGFAVGAPDPAVKRVSIDGKSPIELCKLPHESFSGGTWSPDGERIVFAAGWKLYEVASRGGQPRLLFDSTDSPRPVSLYPHFLPTIHGPLALVYSAAAVPSSRWVTVLNMETGERREFGPGSAPVYSLDGYLIHASTDMTGRGLWALPFSLDTLEATGDAFPISATGFAPSVSDDGALVYRDAESNFGMGTLVWRSRTGEIIEAVGQPQPDISDLAVAPDGRRAAVVSIESGIANVWIHDLTRSTKTRLMLEDKMVGGPVWSPLGREIIYYLNNTGRIMRQAADGSGEAIALIESDRPLLHTDWSRDGRYIVYCERNIPRQGGFDIRYIELGSDGKAGDPVTFLASPVNELHPKVSPDGNFLAYSSLESGQYEVYVRPFPSGSGKWQVSTNGGWLPRWRDDGKELYYIEGDKLMAVAVSTESAFEVGRPQPLFNVIGKEATADRGWVYDVSADGQRFLTVTAVAEADGAPSKIRIVENWYEEFRDREQD